jgi:hypothetical protein
MLDVIEFSCLLENVYETKILGREPRRSRGRGQKMTPGINQKTGESLRENAGTNWNVLDAHMLKYGLFQVSFTGSATF